MKKRKKIYSKVFFPFVCLILIGMAAINPKNTTGKDEPSIPNIHLPELDGVYIKTFGTNYKSAQPDKDQLFRILKKHPIDVVIRLNADGVKLSIEDEANICKDQNVRFYYFNIEGDIPAAYQQIRNFLADGNTLIHCLHGYDRTGVVMGLWMKENGATDQEVITFNQWENYLQNKGEAYQKYWDAVFKK